MKVFVFKSKITDEIIHCGERNGADPNYWQYVGSLDQDIQLEKKTVVKETPVVVLNDRQVDVLQTGVYGIVPCNAKNVKLTYEVEE